MTLPRLRGAAVALLAAAAAGCARAPDARVPQRTSIEGLTYREFLGETLARRLRADQLMLVPKRFGAFQVSAITEIVLTHARVELFEDAGAAGASATGIDAILPANGFAVPGLASVRHLGGATVYGLEVVVARGGAPLARVEAAHASADVRSGNLALREFRMRHLPTGRTVSAHRATWRRGADEFVIAGEYELTEAGRTRTGRGLRIDASFASSGR